MKLEVKYYAVDDCEKVVCTTQRSASVSMVESLGPSQEGTKVRRISVNEAFALKRRGWPLMMWLRNPFERLACAYHIFGRNCTFAEFCERAITERNPHWSPATALHTHSNEFLPTKVYAFDYLEATWGYELPGYSLQHVGANKDRASWLELKEFMSESLLERVIEHFRNDKDLYEWAVANGHMVAA